MAEKSSRLLALDYLRGFFILVIIIDHLWRWPSIFAIFTGMGALWVTSAEGFVIISGLLVGFVRGYKNRSLPLIDVSKKLWKRAAILYVWLVVMTLLYTALSWYIYTPGNIAIIDITKGNWQELIISTLLFTNQHVWVHFLYIYALLLAFTPIIIWFLRKRQWYYVLAFTAVGYIIGRILHIEFMQWMPLFYLPAVAGYYLPQIQSWWANQPTGKRGTLLSLLFGTTLAMIIASIVCIFLIPNNPIALAINNAFTKEYAFNIARIPLALLWFVAFVMLFEYGKRWIGNYFGWILLPFGTRSLTVYITHGIILFIIAYFFALNSSIWYNSAIGVLAIIGSWLFIKIPLVKKYIPQ